MAAVNHRIEQNKRIARRIPEELAMGGDLDLIEELYAVDAVEHDPFRLLQQLGIEAAPTEHQ